MTKRSLSESSPGGMMICNGSIVPYSPYSVILIAVRGDLTVGAVIC
ncbi:hypothetical protein [Ammoniphilus oxalaticus]|nr:hypothetical protein [Ammoniphilus oxalaticus]